MSSTRTRSACTWRRCGASSRPIRRSRATCSPRSAWAIASLPTESAAHDLQIVDQPRRAELRAREDHELAILGRGNLEIRLLPHRDVVRLPPVGAELGHGLGLEPLIGALAGGDRARELPENAIEPGGLHALR